MESVLAQLLREAMEALQAGDTEEAFRRLCGAISEVDRSVCGLIDQEAAARMRLERAVFRGEVDEGSSLAWEVVV